MHRLRLPARLSPLSARSVALLLALGGVVALFIGQHERAALFAEHTERLASYGAGLAHKAASVSPLSWSPSSFKQHGLAGGLHAHSRGVLESCSITDRPEDPLVKEYGQNNIRLSRTYEGSGVRVRKVLQKALRGEPIHVAAVGGSVSAVSHFDTQFGHSLYDEAERVTFNYPLQFAIRKGHAVPWPFTSEYYMYKRVHKWLQDTFPDAKHKLNTDSTVPAVSAWYFSYCIMATLPQDADLVFLELDINQWAPEEKGVLENTERLYRSILSLPNEPALIYLSVFGLVFQDLTHGWRSSALISQWLDVPEINLRNWYLPHLMMHPKEIPFMFRAPRGHVDQRHINKEGHRALADMTIAYLREQLCLAQRQGPLDLEPSVSHWPGNEITEQLPRLGMLHKWSENASMPVLHPRCETVSSKRQPLKARSMDGWELVNRNDKKSFEASVPGSVITFNVNIVEGHVGLFVWKSPFEGFGEVTCWLDDNDEDGKRKIIRAYTNRRPAASFEHTGNMFSDVGPGNHVLSCRLKAMKDGGNVFRISAVVTR